MFIGVRRVIGDSMSPYLVEHDLIVVLKSKNYRVGDVVGFSHGGKVLIKRVSKIKDDQIYVLGDNPKNSLDSRKFGWIDAKTLIFKLVFKF